MLDALDFGSLPDWCVFTTPDVVSKALDAIGWTSNMNLAACRLVEPAAGDGAFVVEAVRRLLASCAEYDTTPTWTTLCRALRCYEIEPVIARSLKANVETLLIGEGVHSALARRLTAAWCLNADFFHADVQTDFTHAVGNPPFKRGGGASPDQCVRFMERSFDLLRDGGRMAMLAPVSLASAAGSRSIRRRVELEGKLEFLERYDAQDAFTRKVSVDGCLYVISKHGYTSADASSTYDSPSAWFAGSSAACSAFLLATERFPTLLDAGCKVKLGMPTGKNGIFVGNAAMLDVERDVMVPVVNTGDLRDGIVDWRGLYVIDTSDTTGTPWTKEQKPKLDAYLRRHEKQLRDRYTVKGGLSWRLTHSKVDHELAAASKLLVAETAKPCRVSLDTGGFMPLSTLHAVTSTEWPLKALQRVLSIVGVGLLANAIFLKRNGGHLRMNATALKQVRIPIWSELSNIDKENLSGNEFDKACETCSRVYTMDDKLLQQCAEACRG